jgi:hypothetical protein
MIPSGDKSNDPKAKGPKKRQKAARRQLPPTAGWLAQSLPSE